MSSAFDFIKKVFASWGRAPRRASEHHSGRTLYLYLPVQSRMVPVGTLSQEGKEFVFVYDKEFRRRDDLPPISAFPDKGGEYRSETLWPFFDVRLPPVERADVASKIKEKHLDPEDTLALLAEFGRKTLTTPYEFTSTRFSDPGYRVLQT